MWSRSVRGVWGGFFSLNLTLGLDMLKLKFHLVCWIVFGCVLCGCCSCFLLFVKIYYVLEFLWKFLIKGTIFSPIFFSFFLLFFFSGVLKVIPSELWMNLMKKQKWSLFVKFASSNLHTKELCELYQNNKWIVVTLFRYREAI